MGRIFKRLKERAELVEALRKDPWQPRRSFKRPPYGIRKPKQNVARAPGDLVQVE